ncbi:transposase, IS4 [Candidatus Protofrankia californiensis]|uniref:Transposase, IS4 n=1 Tax=Candidatus Protofrankia californiensis TaxID=1839754 RepID=A0A1C3NXM0_9ACTN|nr:transposase, IS4 [Candidatus Protofrankia californiensis]
MPPLVCGLLTQTRERTVCGMLLGAGLSRVWPHHRAHRFFSHAVWSPDPLGLALARLVITVLVPGGAVTVAVDDTLFRRSGTKVWAASWFHDGSAASPTQVGFGNTWVLVGIVVRLPMLDRPVCLPVLARLVRKNTVSASRLWLTRRMVTALAAALPDRRLHVVADAAYAGRELRGLPARVTWTTRLRADAALYELAPPRTGRCGRPRLKGDRLPGLAALAAHAPFTPLRVEPVRAEHHRGHRHPPLPVMARSAPGRSPSSCCVRPPPTPAAAMTPPWSPPIPSPDRLRSSTGMPLAGRWKPRSRTPSRSSGSGRPVTGVPAPSSALSRSV